ncbi:hypothetical protein OHA79_04715 [Streptomyces sp. NBC_00841]|uniref:hypothetical protein n=1 Tax=Streptomyces sp. NBC_00841 TaxID=2975847 RepID=UPI002DDA8A48|nr:hypothetical protein [Streptomyces sp. NBC_00841]WRZ97256.1 hypothetical protein OHA79_04715 [Streptomyces sp. NBC_00841]
MRPRPGTVVVEQQVSSGVEDNPGRRQALQGIVRVRQIIQSVCQSIPRGLDRLGLQRRRTVAEVGLGLRPGTPGLSTDVDQDQAGGIHALQHTTTRGDVCGEEFPETGTGVDVELRKAPFEPNVSR